MNAAELHPLLTHHVVNTLGWPFLRPLQQQAVGPLTAGDHALLLAPTAGGKTEAAVFPTFSRMLAEGWFGLSVLYLCPLRALLNNLTPRLQSYADLLGRRAALWHGDVAEGQRQRIRSEPPDVLLTTPESVEAMLISSKTDHAWLFRNLQTIVVDEIHAFAGDDRGWHLLSVVQRLQRLSGREPQRIGLSATVGDPRAMLDWVCAGTNGRRTLLSLPSGRARAVRRYARPCRVTRQRRHRPVPVASRREAAGVRRFALPCRGARTRAAASRRANVAQSRLAGT